MFTLVISLALEMTENDKSWAFRRSTFFRNKNCCCAGMIAAAAGYLGCHVSRGLDRLFPVAKLRENE